MAEALVTAKIIVITGTAKSVVTTETAFLAVTTVATVKPVVLTIAHGPEEVTGGLLGLSSLKSYAMSNRYPIPQFKDFVTLHGATLFLI